MAISLNPMKWFSKKNQTESGVPTGYSGTVSDASQNHKTKSREEAEAMASPRPEPTQVPEDSHYEKLNLQNLSSMAPKDAKGAEKILKFFEMDKNESVNATLCTKKNHIAVHVPGDLAARKLFNTSFGYTVFGLARFFGKPNKRIGARLFNKGGFVSLIDKAAKGEKLSHIIEALKSNQYSVNINFEIGEDGKFDLKKPISIGLIDSYQRSMEKFKSQRPQGMQLETYERLKAKLDKVEASEFTDFHNCNSLLTSAWRVEKYKADPEARIGYLRALSESMPQGTRLFIPQSMHKDQRNGKPYAEAVSKNKSYTEFDFENPLNNGNAQPIIDRKPITIVADRSEQFKPIPEDLAFAHHVHRLQQMQDLEKLGANEHIEKAIDFNKSSILDYNASAQKSQAA